MSATSVQFSVAAHIMTALGYHYGEQISSSTLAQSINADPTFVRKSLSKLAKAGLVVTARGKNGACALALPPQKITLLDIYRASEAPPAVALHRYPTAKACPVSRHMNAGMAALLAEAQNSFERTLQKKRLADLVASVRKARG